MADSDVKFTVVADTRAAKGELSDLEKAAERVQNASNRGGGGGGGGGGNPPRPGGEGEEFGKAAGKQIGKALAGFMAREASGILFNELRRRGMGGQNLDIAQGALGGALAFGTTGAMLGGPLGALIGGGLGAAAGGIKVWQEKEELKQKQIEELEDHPRQTNQSLAAWTQQAAMERIIRLTPLSQRYSQIEMMQDVQAQRVDHFRQAMEMMVKMGDKLPENLRKETAETYQTSVGMLRMLNQAGVAAQMDLLMKDATAKPPDIAVDAFAQRGLYAGAMVTPDAYQASVQHNLERAVDILNNILEVARGPKANVNSITDAGMRALFGD